MSKVLRLEPKIKKRITAMDLDLWLAHRSMNLMTKRVNDHNSRVIKANEAAAEKAKNNTKDSSSEAEANPNP